MTVSEIINAIRQLPLADQQKVLEETQRGIRQAEAQTEEEGDWTEHIGRGSILSPDDEKNVQLIWKSPGGC